MRIAKKKIMRLKKRYKVPFLKPKVEKKRRARKTAWV